MDRFAGSCMKRIGAVGFEFSFHKQFGKVLDILFYDCEYRAPKSVVRDLGVYCSPPHCRSPDSVGCLAPKLVVRNLSITTYCHALGPCVSDHVCESAQAFLQKHREDTDIWAFGTPISRLAAGKVIAFQKKFVDLLEDAWWEFTIASADTESQSFLRHTVVCLVTYYAASFHRRIYLPLSRFPYRLLGMLLSPADQPCEIRMSIARQVVHTEVHLLEINTKKFCLLFLSEFQYASATGLMDKRLWVCLVVLRYSLKGDSAAAETINKMITIQGDRAPNISLDLLNARMNIKYQLRSSREARHNRWRDIRPHALSLARTCIQYESSGRVVRSATRFAPPEALTDADLPNPTTVRSDSATMDPSLALTDAEVWASKHSCALARSVRTGSVIVIEPRTGIIHQSPSIILHRFNVSCIHWFLLQHVPKLTSKFQPDCIKSQTKFDNFL